ncbi:MAG TPA: sigma-70 family RNA polymerase sigma factor, partial [Polyangiaceae bacterium]|nr:sigma-70 family RNA polymerase sigma factor [Polyangiaceae bacterium]
AHVASKAHRAARRRVETPMENVDESESDSPLQDALLDERRARDLLDEFLSELADDVRAVFVLFEIEGLRAPEVAEALEIPVGTVASRLRRARAEISAKLSRREARSAFKGRRA